MDSAFSPLLEPAEPSELSLGEVVALLGPRALQPMELTDPAVPVHGFEFVDSFDGLREPEGLLLLVPAATQPGVAQLDGLAGQAARLGCAALVLSHALDHGVATEEISRRHAVSILRLAPGVAWRTFEAMLATALGERVRVEDARSGRSAEPLFGLADQLAARFGGSVAIEDLGRRIIAYSSLPGQLIDSFRSEGILARRVPESPVNDVQYRAVMQADGPLKFPAANDEHARAAIAIRAGSYPLGSIWVIDAGGNGSIPAESSRALVHAARVASAHLLDDIRVREAGQYPREELFRSMLDGRVVAGTELMELGFREPQHPTLLVFHPRSDVNTARLAQLRSALRRQLSAHHPELVVVVHQRRVCALLDLDGEAVQTAESLLPALDRLVGAGTVVAIPGTLERPEQLADLRDNAEEFFRVAEQDAAPHRVLTSERLRSALLISRVSAQLVQQPELFDSRVVRLWEHERQTATTMLIYFECFSNVPRTAQRLRVHENTVRNRLRRVTESFGLDVSGTDPPLAIWLQLQALEKSSSLNEQNE